MEATTTPENDTACDGPCGQMHPAAEMVHGEFTSECGPCREAR